MKLKVSRSSGNVFRDLGFSEEEAEHLKIRSDLMIQLQKVIASRGLKQAQAAKILRVTQPRVSDLLRGRIDLFSTDALIDMLARLGVRVNVVLKPSRGGLKVAYAMGERRPAMTWDDAAAFPGRPFDLKLEGATSPDEQRQVQCRQTRIQQRA